MTSPNAYYICPVCKQPATRHWNMSRHMKGMHPECKKKPKHVFLMGSTPILRKGDKLKIDVYPKPKVISDSITMLGKAKSKRSEAQKARWEKYHCYRQAFLNMGYTPMTPKEKKKYKATAPVDLHLTREDARKLNIVLLHAMKYLTYETADSMNRAIYNATAQRVLNKLKRAGIS